MPLKIRFHLEGEAPSDPYQHARGLRALVLDWIGEIDPAYSKEVHDANQPKPYSIGTLRRHDTLRRACSFDLALLVDALYAPILQGQRQTGETFQLGRVGYRIREVEILRPLTYEEIVHAAPDTAREFRFRQVTPTAHHRGSEIRKAILLPDPELYFGNWWMRWNLCSEWQIARNLLEVVERQVAITYCQGGTQTANIDKERNFAGFRGDVTFALLKPDTVSPEVRQALAALTLFAEYSGTGVDTMRGMGETQLLDIL